MAKNKNVAANTAKVTKIVLILLTDVFPPPRVCSPPVQTFQTETDGRLWLARRDDACRLASPKNEQCSVALLPTMTGEPCYSKELASIRCY
jgi:hypothetical protein